ncbi:hypothetical protein [Goekera deserti]|uniref:Uncharacterized protein n=1 Tax=Goekera deserti TaxID=2497753 RepID=A0A7K3WIL1_9ACTN|nr:hypothetical protein [Goekera deserti]NDI47021.1 hypothetical protein [Goekera deserti]NEL56257.1 hypothetical protein [Goekera deserti]
MHVGLALCWLLDPGSRPGLEGDASVATSVLTELPPTVTAALLLGVATVGLVLAGVVACRRPTTALVAAAGVLAVVLGVLSADLRVLVLLGYLCAVLGPVAVVVLLLAGALRSRRGRPWAAGVLVVLLAGWWVGLLEPRTVGDVAVSLGTALANEGWVRVHLALLLGGAVLWALVAVAVRRSARGACADCGRPGARWTEPAAALRWGRVATAIAVAGPLPYGLLRMSWLTPWPVGLLGTEDVADPAVRLFGLGLGAAALGGTVLTAGLLRPWGEVWPAWVPVLRGRAVPVRVPVVAGGLVAVVLLAATPGIVGPALDGLAAGDWQRASFLLLFPTLPWGLALAAAVTAYLLRRRGACAVCGAGELALWVRA